MNRKDTFKINYSAKNKRSVYTKTMNKTAVYSSHCNNTHTEDHTSGLQYIVSGRGCKFYRRPQNSSSRKNMYKVL